MASAEKLWPQSIEAEVGVLGALIIDPEGIVDLESKVHLRPQDFYRDAHQILYQALLDLHEKNEPADFITICDYLDRLGKLDAVGGASYLTSLISDVPTSGNLIYYAQIVRQCSGFRKLIHIAGKIAALAYSRDENAMRKAEQMIFALNQEFLRLSSFVHVEETVASVLGNIQRIYESADLAITGVPSGFPSLDEVVGGFQKSDLIILGARPGLGKTSLALALADHAARKKKLNVAFFSQEMSSEQLVQRLLAMDTGYDTQKFRNGKGLQDDDWERIITSSDALSEAHLWIDDTGNQDVLDIAAKARKLHAEVGLDLIIVDYLQLCHATINGQYVSNEVQETTIISKTLKAVAKELNVPVIALSQLSRAVEGRQSKIPQLSDLRQSGSIEQDADVVIFLYRKDYYERGNGGLSDRPGEADLIVAKHRNGPCGELTIFFYASTTRFFNSIEDAERVYGRLPSIYYGMTPMVVESLPVPATPSPKITDWRQALVWEQEEPENGNES